MPNLDFCRMIAETITSSHNQHATLMIYARTGAGKSWAALGIGEVVSEYVAEIKGGSPKDYFSPENIAIITQEEVIRVIENRLDSKYSVIGFDDIGVGWNSRDFMTDFNKSMNDIYQTFRTRNVFLYVTLPDPMLIDLVPRDMIRYIMEIDSSHFEYGYVEAKVFELTKKARLSKKIYPYLLDTKGNRIVRHIIFEPSQELVKNYEPRRTEIEKQNTDKAVVGLKEWINKSNAKDKKVTEGKIRAEIAATVQAEFGVTQKRAAKVCNISARRLQQIAAGE